MQRKARQINTEVHPDFRPTNMSSGCYSAELEFVVSSTGTPDETTVRVLHTNTPAYADAVLAIIPRLRYEPAQRDGSPVAQIVAQKFEMMTKVVVVPAGTRPTAPRPGPGC